MVRVSTELRRWLRATLKTYGSGGEGRAHLLQFLECEEEAKPEAKDGNPDHALPEVSIKAHKLEQQDENGATEFYEIKVVDPLTRESKTISKRYNQFEELVRTVPTSQFRVRT